MFAQRFLTRSVISGVNRIKNVAKYSLHEGTATYEGDGKTKVSIMNQDADAGLLINAFSQMGFRLNNGMMVMGPMAIFPKTVMSWNIENFQEINDKSLSLFCVLEPKIDVLVIGTGDATITPEFSKKIISFMRRFGINVEVLPTEQACTTFNFLNGEGRMVAGAFLPPVLLSVSESDYVRHQLDRKNLLEIED